MRADLCNVLDLMRRSAATTINYWTHTGSLRPWVVHNPVGTARRAIELTGNRSTTRVNYLQITTSIVDCRLKAAGKYLRVEIANRGQPYLPGPVTGPELEEKCYQTGNEKHIDQSYKRSHRRWDWGSIWSFKLSQYEAEGKKGHYLTLIQEYMNIMSIKRTSVEAERAFSAAPPQPISYICIKLRTRLGDKTINTLCFLRSLFQTQK